MREAERREQDTGLWIARCLGRRDFALLGNEDIAAFSRALRAVAFTRGDKLFRQGETPREAHIVREGEIELSHRDGRKRVVLGIAREGEIVGDVSLLCESPHSFTAVARTSGSTLTIGNDELIPLLKRHPSIALRWLMSVIERMDRTTNRIIEMTNRDLRGRIVSFLADELRARGDGVTELPISQDTLAALVGASRQSVNEALGRLRAERLIETGYGRIRILRPGALGG